MKKYLYIFGLITFCILLTGCAINLSPEELEEIPEYGFLYGIFHAYFLPLSFLCSFFDDSFILYSNHNTGFGYNTGFVIGLFLLKTSISKFHFIMDIFTD